MNHNRNLYQDPTDPHFDANESNLNPSANGSVAKGESQQGSLLRPSFWRVTASFFLILIIIVFLLFLTLLSTERLQDGLIALKSQLIAPYYPDLNSAKNIKQDLHELEKRLASLGQSIEKLTPRRPYLIIDTSSNTFFVMKGDELLRQGVCSTGSYTLLKSADEKQQWIFKTPRGAFRVRNKATNPIWYLPDWAFVEAGRPIPPHGSPERVEYGVLGDYALHLGSGYLIHGTLYERYLGLPVTHGCIRVGDEDLKYLFKTLTFAARVFIY